VENTSHLSTPISPCAKLSRPKLHQVVQRERVDALFDEARVRPSVWVTSPPGSGKTTAVASYLEANKVPGLWYHIDSGDRDIASFFYYLSLAADSLGGKRKIPLPLLTPEYWADIPAYARHYFRLFFSRLKAPAVLVLDNYHELPADSIFHGLLEQAILEAPEGINVIVISRTEPPAQCVRLEATDRISRIGYEALRLTLDEAREIAAQRHEVNEATLRILHAQSGGWVAGLTLTLERMKQLGSPPQEVRGEALESVFEYFAGQILKSMEPEMKDFLLRSALLPRMTAVMAQQLSGNANAETLLDSLYRRRLFTDKRGDSYQYHDLFRAFLLEQLRRAYTEQGLNELRRRAGRLLEDAQEFEDAFQLYHAAQDWQAAADLVLAQAPMLLARGRGQTLREWIGALSAELIDRFPWLEYWLGTSLVQVEPVKARVSLARAFRQFTNRQDTLGAILACSGIIHTYNCEWVNLAPLDPWIDELLALLEADPDFPSPSIELDVNTALVFALTWRRPDSKRLQRHRARTLHLLSAEVPANSKAFAAAALLDAFSLAEEMDQAARLIAQMQPLCALDAVSPVNKAYWLQIVGFHRFAMCDLRGATKALQSELQIVQTHALALTVLPALANIKLSLCALESGDLTLAELYSERAAAFRDPARFMDQLDFALVKYGIAAHRKDWDRALRYAELTDTAASEAHSVWHMLWGKLCVAFTLIETARHAEATQVLSTARKLVAGTTFYRRACEVEYLEAYSALRKNEKERCHALLRTAVAIAKRDEYNYTIRILPSLLSCLFAEALQAEIDVEYVGSLIRKLNIPPPSPDAENWLWPVKVCTLGRFLVVIEDEPLGFRGKPLELLKAMLAHGGLQVGQVGLIEQLWPDLEGDAGRNAFDVALHRLRKLLRRDDLLSVQDGKLALDARQVWVDTWAFERLCDTLDRAKAAHFGKEALMATAQRMLGLYGGHFLSGDEVPWAIEARERLPNKFLRSVSELGQCLEREGEWAEVTALYRRAIELDPLAEEFHRGLMLSFRAQGRVAEALDVYRHCRDLFSITLGVEPSAPTQTVYRSLKQ
jgi:LuxR family transcriptional regulator, maltose regulon positive regulatory protein